MKKFLMITASFLFLITVFDSPLFAETYSQTFEKDGKTYVTTKTIDGDKITIETKIYDSSGNLLDSKTVEKDAKPTPVKEVVYPTKTYIDTDITKPIENKEMTQEQAMEKENEEEQVEEKLMEKDRVGNTSLLTSDYPLEISSESGNLVVKTQSGDKELKVSTEAVVQKAESAGLSSVSEVKLVQNQNTFSYMITGTKNEKLFGFVKVYLPTSLTYNTDNGALEKTTQSIIVKIADFLSF